MRNANSLPDLSRPTTSTGQRGVSISSESKVRNDMNFRQQARKEAYSILRDNSHRGGSFMNSVEEEAVAEMPSILPILKQKGGINFNASSASGTEHGAFPAHLTRASFIFS